MRKIAESISFTMPIVIMGILMPILFSCTRAIRTPICEFREESKPKGSVFRVTTMDNKSFEFDSYTVSGDTVVIKIPHKYIDHREVEMRLTFDQVKEVERVEINKKKTTIFLSILAVFLLGAGYGIYLIGTGLSQLD